ncbi:MAG: VOC family protein [Candidatus Eremiobacteraeota bacterium]|nr:VOC family protein [Candidatus Eremiobacteraeota bacterium]
MQETKMVVRGIDASYYMTKDLDVATEFYNKLLGMEPTMSVPNTVVEYTFADDGSFGLYKTDRFFESGTVMFRVDDVAAFVKAAMANGVAFAGDGLVDETPGCYMAFGTDPDGNHFMVHKTKEGR